MLRDAINSIRVAEDEALRRRAELRSRRRPIQLIDYWVGELELLMEHDEPAVPEPLIKDIILFIGKVNPRLNRRLRPAGARSASSVLDVLFDVEAQLLPNPPNDAA